MNELDHKIAVVTGASSGIGLATAKKLAGEGASVFAFSRKAIEAEGETASAGPHITAIRGDVTQINDVRRLYSAASAINGKIDIIVANAALSRPEALGAITSASIDEQTDTNFKAVITTIQEALPLTRDGGSIVLVGSIAAVKAVPTQSVYAATKAAVRSLARSWALELAPRRIRVNVVSPGAIDTPGMAAFMDDAIRSMLASSSPAGRLGEAEEVADLIAWLCSSPAAYVNGADMQIDGGRAQI